VPKLSPICTIHLTQVKLMVLNLIKNGIEMVSRMMELNCE